MAVFAPIDMRTMKICIELDAHDEIELCKQIYNGSNRGVNKIEKNKNW